MYQITKEFDMDCAHYLGGYEGPCKNAHGHTYKVYITVEGEELDDLGMLVDYSVIKRLIHGRYDHTCLNDWDEFKYENPTAESLAREICGRVQAYCYTLPHLPRCSKVVVYETPTSRAVYTPLYIGGEKLDDNTEHIGEGTTR